MKKYLEIMHSVFFEYFAMRSRFFLWRLRQVIFLLVTFLIWSSIFYGREVIFGYTSSEMLTYVLLASFIGNFALGTRSWEVAEKIVNGDIINNILKPVSIFKFHLARDFADKLTNIGFAIVEISILIAIFKPPIFIQTDPGILLITLLFIILGTLIAFFLAMSFSFIGFWTTEYWAVQFVFYILLSFVTGTYFPLDILPRPLYLVLLLTPFPYLYYLPTKIFIRGIESSILPELLISLIWVYLIYKIAGFLWNKGLREYNFFGR